MRTTRWVLGLAILTLALSVGGCGRKSDTVVKREGEPDYVRVFDKKRMETAIAEAKSTLDVFVAALKEGREGTGNFTIKKGFKYGADGEEFIWINEIKLVGDVFEGRINNEPVDAKDLKLGQTVQVKREEVADWMFMKDGRLEGGYTIVALTHGTPEQARYEKEMGIDWSKYKFLQSTK